MLDRPRLQGNGENTRFVAELLERDDLWMSIAPRASAVDERDYRSALTASSSSLRSATKNLDITIPSS